MSRPPAVTERLARLNPSEELPVAMIGMEMGDKHARVLIDRDRDERSAWSAKKAAQRSDILERIDQQAPRPIPQLYPCP